MHDRPPSNARRQRRYRARQRRGERVVTITFSAAEVARLHYPARCIDADKAARGMVRPVLRDLETQ
jgi:hypothetical protein